jgi:hypothetical protein
VVVRRLSEVNWAAPWFAPVEANAAALRADDWRAQLNRRAATLTTAFGHPLHFDEPVAAGDLPYELHIAHTGSVPTRDNLHDVFNALIWLNWPRSKARLNALQAIAIEQAGVRGRRGALRDAATLLDENGVFVATDDVQFIDALRGHRWIELFWERRSHWKQVAVFVFGHALLEKLVRPYKAITGHALIVPRSRDDFQTNPDTLLAALLDEGLTPQRLAPLPVLGIPGWHAENEQLAFYQDATVFRPPRER